jgi:hypothetical protein
MRLRADSELDHQRFVSRVVQSGSVWAIKGKAGVAPFHSDSDDERQVLPFWSDPAYARRAAVHLEQGDLLEISLFDFLYRWLPGMAKDHLCAGTNWASDLSGHELEPLDLQDEILNALPETLRLELLKRLEREIAGQSE